MIGFYIFMLICAFLIPATMLFFGYRWQKKPPGKINFAYGYRTRRSMSSQEAWVFAHKFFGKLWIQLGWITLAVSALLMGALACITLEITAVGIVGCAAIFLQLIPMIAPLFATETALKQKFGI